ncbi:ATP-binding cassette domain-containing protein [Pseudoroseomonas wenyumeiae]|uniref:ABC transporter ATP-binding protein n=1 Tax=Teichococcus wenyumeiae TaxID=2478470 RepID=A0A3A9JKP9_9PROT|nr:ABC transporter ATP-binding protein [Pseudoroseomonas wenyumeiae]RKK04376.1 ABC transporter ATP-binding protein [Pseudoroseomonas wenyumeiae]RMI24822.1 ATP-binding cassette domain-containing protein [Pseudoroseomonas wenyumeiae]
MTILSVRNATVTYDAILAVSDVSIEVPRGSIVTILGPNGAGKSSLLNAIMGVVPASGSVTFAGRDLRGESVEARVNDGLSLVPEKRELFSSMTVEDNLRLGRFRLRHKGSAEPLLNEMFALFPRLKERRKQLAGTLSGGERQMLAMARALMGEPRLLMLDEPSLGLAPLIVREILQTAANLRDNGTSILLVEQNARAALRIADYGYVLENGRVMLEGEPGMLQADSRIIESYLGVRSAVSV